MTSCPVSPKMESLPPNPEIVSFTLDPGRKSLPGVPVITAILVDSESCSSSHSAGTARAGGSARFNQTKRYLNGIVKASRLSAPSTLKQDSQPPGRVFLPLVSQ